MRVDGSPRPQPRPRAFVRQTATGPVARVFDSGSAESWKAQIALAAKEHVPPTPIDAPVVLSIVFILPRPQTRMRRADPDGRVPHVQRPDLENLIKAVMDCFTELGVWRDDCLVQELAVTKCFAAKAEDRAGAEIRISWPDDVRPGLMPPRRAPAQPQQDAPF